jgi:hypothetical protein
MNLVGLILGCNNCEKNRRALEMLVGAGVSDAMGDGVDDGLTVGAGVGAGVSDAMGDGVNDGLTVGAGVSDAMGDGVDDGLTVPAGVSAAMGDPPLC